MNNYSQSSYRSIFKATSLFGSVQIYNIIIGIIKSKVIAILLGPLGVGVIGLFLSAEQLIKSLTAMGLSSSAVRDISEANSKNDTHYLSLKVTVLKRLVFLTGTLGLLTTLFLSPVLSKVSFGNYDYAIPFAFFSITLLFDQISSGQRIVLQGLRRLKDLAKASVLGSTMGLIVSIPIYYFWGVSGIVPTLFLTSCVILLCTWFYARKTNLVPVKLDFSTLKKEGSTMLKLGIAMSLTSILSTLGSYIIRTFIRYDSGVDAVGLYTAGFTLMSTYAGLVFTAMSTDYFPRLASVNNDNNKCREIINQQGEIGLLLLCPLLVVCMIFVPVVILILYSNQFIPAGGYILWASCGMLFRMASWAISYVYVAKAEAKLFASIEILANVILVLLSVLGYKIHGLAGLGVAFCLFYIIYLIIVYYFARRRYDFHFSDSFVRIFLFNLLMITISLIIILTMASYKYILGSVIIVTTILYSYMELNKRIKFVNMLKHGKK